MHTKFHLRNPSVLLVALLASLLQVGTPAPAAAQSTGTIEFTAHVAPIGGRPEPVREMMFYALRKSLENIRQEVAQLEPAPDLEKFVDTLSVSPELKAWMKKYQTVQLAGADFTRILTGDDIVDVPEFFDAYMSRNSGFEGIGFPKPKFREKDKTASPEKYKQLRQEYKSAVRTFIVAMPESVHGIEADLNGIDPYRAWTQMQTDRNRRVQRRTIELAQKSYLAARTDTDLNGRGAFAGLPSGDYWIGTLATPATAGDVRLHWDLHVVVRPGETARLELSNLNAAEPLGLAQNSAP